MQPFITLLKALLLNCFVVGMLYIAFVVLKNLGRKPGRVIELDEHERRIGD